VIRSSELSAPVRVSSHNQVQGLNWTVQLHLEMSRCNWSSVYVCVSIGLFAPCAVLGIFIWVGQSKAKQILGRSNRSGVRGGHWDDPRHLVGQARVWVGHSLPGLIARTASGLLCWGTGYPRLWNVLEIPGIFSIRF